MSKNKDKKKFDPLVAVVIRNKFYRDTYRRLLYVLTVTIVINFMLGGGYYYLVTHPTLPVYFATTVSDRILPVYPLSEPNRSDEDVLKWAQTAAMAAFTFNYSNYRREFTSASEFFSPFGWTQFLDALKSSNNLEAVMNKKLVVSAQLLKSKKQYIRKSGVLKGSGRFAWRVKIPLLITYQSTEVFTQESATITMMVVRLSTLNSPSGIGIEQFVVKPGVSD